MRGRLCVSLVCLLAANSARGQATIEYDPPRRIGTVEDSEIREASGIAAARRGDGFWLHNDSGDTPRLFLIDRAGRVRGVAAVEGAAAKDWEDMASFELDGRAYLLAADVGDNFKLRPNVTLYIVEEPNVAASGDGAVMKTSLPLVAAIPLVYEFGSANCESVAVDTVTRTIYLVTKEPKSPCRVYAAPLVLESPAEPIMARRVAELEVPTMLSMDISADGRRAVLLGHDAAYEFERACGATWADAFARPSRVLRVPERKNGEAICYGLDGKSLYLTNEGVNQPLWEIPPRP